MTDSRNVMLLRRVETYLKATRTPPTRFGRDALKDPGLVFDLRDSRQPRAATVERVTVFLDARDDRPQNADVG